MLNSDDIGCFALVLVFIFGLGCLVFYTAMNAPAERERIQKLIAEENEQLSQDIDFCLSRHSYEDCMIACQTQYRTTPETRTETRWNGENLSWRCRRETTEKRGMFSPTHPHD